MYIYIYMNICIYVYMYVHLYIYVNIYTEILRTDFVYIIILGWIVPLSSFIQHPLSKLTLRPWNGCFLTS